MTTDLAERDESGLDDLQRMMSLAIQQGPDGVESLRQLVELKREEEDRQARRDYFAALSTFQQECPTIERHKGIPDAQGRIKYRYAPLEDIIRTVDPYLLRHGLSRSFNVSYPDGSTEVCCTLAHLGGHAEQSCVRMPGVQVPKANAAQNEGAAVTYGKRLAFLNATGLTTADEDTDGTPPEPLEPVTQEQADTLRALADEVFVPSQFARFLATYNTDAWAGIPAAKYEDAHGRLVERRRYLETHPDAMEKFEAAKREAAS